MSPGLYFKMQNNGHSLNGTSEKQIIHFVSITYKMICLYHGGGKIVRHIISVKSTLYDNLEEKKRGIRQL